MVKTMIPYLFARLLTAQTPIHDSLIITSMLREDSSLAMVKKMSISGPHSEYSPMLRGNLLYFVSDRPNRTGIQYTDIHNNPGITDIFVADISSGKKTRTPESLEGLNSKYYEGPFCFSAGGDTIYFTGNDRKSRRLRLMTSERKKEGWSEPEILPFCRDTFSYCHPAISADGRTLYFSSNSDGGKDMDLYVCTRSDTSWSAPRYLDEINTTFNELFPFAGRDGYLYFSSNRPGGPGGLDLYVLKQAADHPLMLYPPINSEHDDFGVFVRAQGDTGFVSSNRAGKKNDDLYQFVRSIPDFSAAEAPPVRRKYCYSFYEESSVRDNDTSGNEYEWRFGDGNTAKGLRSRHCYNAPGNYTIQLIVIEKASKKEGNTLVNYVISIPEPESIHIRSADTLKLGDTLLCDASGSALKDHDINEMYWSFGDGYYNRGPVAGHRFRNAGIYVLELWVTATHRPTSEQKKYRISKQITVRSNQ